METSRALMRDALTDLGGGQRLRKAALDCTGIPGGRQAHSGDSRVSFGVAHDELAPRSPCARVRASRWPAAFVLPASSLLHAPESQAAAPTFLKDLSLIHISEPTRLLSIS